MSNREIRRRAWAQFKAHYWRLLPSMAIVEALMLAPSVITAPLGPVGPASPLIASCGLLLFAPVALLGAAGVTAEVMRGGAPETRRMLWALEGGRRAARAWLASLAYYGPSLVLGIVSAATPRLGDSFVPTQEDAMLIAAAGIGLLLLLPPALFFGIWLPLRWGLFPYAAERAPEARASSWLGASFRAMRGNCWRLIRLLCSVFWPSAAVAAVLSAVTQALTRSGALAPGSAPAQMASALIISLFLCFYMGYPLLALAGFAGARLEEGAAAQTHAEGGRP